MVNNRILKSTTVCLMCQDVLQPNLSWTRFGIIVGDLSWRQIYTKLWHKSLLDLIYQSQSESNIDTSSELCLNYTYFLESTEIYITKYQNHVTLYKYLDGLAALSSG